MDWIRFFFFYLCKSLLLFWICIDRCLRIRDESLYVFGNICKDYPVWDPTFKDFFSTETGMGEKILCKSFVEEDDDYTSHPTKSHPPLILLICPYIHFFFKFRIYTIFLRLIKHLKFLNPKFSHPILLFSLWVSFGIPLPSSDLFTPSQVRSSSPSCLYSPRHWKECIAKLVHILAI